MLKLLKIRGLGSKIPEEPPISEYLPPAFESTDEGHIHLNSNSVSYNIIGETQYIAFQGFLTIRVSPEYQSQLPPDQEILRVHLPTQMWVAENGVEFIRIPGPTYNLIAPVGLPGDIMAKVNFSKPLGFNRAVHNLSVGVDIMSATDINGVNVAHLDADGNVRADMILDVQWIDCTTCRECGNRRIENTSHCTSCTSFNAARSTAIGKNSRIVSDDKPVTKAVKGCVACSQKK